MTNEVILIIGLLFFLAVAAVVLLGIALRKNDDLREKNKKYIEMNRDSYVCIGEMRGRNVALNVKCEQLAYENATLASENARLRNCSFGVMMRDWERIEDEGRVYYEKDKLRLIVEDGKVVVWYRPEEETSAPAEATADEPEEVTDAVDRAEK